MDITNVERSFGELLAAFGDLVVARTRGGPVDAAGPSVVALARRYRTRRRAFDLALAALDVEKPEGEGDEAAALDNIRGTLPWLDEAEPTPGLRPAGGAVASEEP